MNTTPLKNGLLQAPVMQTAFGGQLDLRGLIPDDCDCVMVLINSGSGINAGNPQPLGFLRLSHQIYIKDIERIIERYERAQDTPQLVGKDAPLWRITVHPVRSKDHLTIWEVPSHR